MIWWLFNSVDVDMLNTVDDIMCHLHAHLVNDRNKYNITI